MSRRYKIILVSIAILLVAFTVYLFSRRSEEEVVILPPPEETNIVQGPLAPEKEKLRQELIAPLGGAPGEITDGPDYRISYLSAGPVFQIEIKTTYIARAKEGAIQFFKNKGFDEQDICNLPVAFYLGPEPFRELEGSGVVVSPKPDFCQ